jgi:hypothetical protein
MNMNTTKESREVCQSADEVIYSEKLHIIFRIVNIKVDPYLNTLIQKIWEQDEDIILHNKDLVYDLMIQFQRIKTYISSKQHKGEIINKDIIHLWENIVPVIEQNINNILQANTLYEQQKNTENQVLQHTILQKNEEYRDQGRSVITTINSQSVAEAKKIILNIEDTKKLIHLFIQTILELIDQKSLKYAQIMKKHLEDYLFKSDNINNREAIVTATMDLDDILAAQ